eukprot:scaffold21702_cov90-Isochrysis_galbana.AAC.2
MQAEAVLSIQGIRLGVRLSLDRLPVRATAAVEYDWGAAGAVRLGELLGPGGVCRLFLEPLRRFSFDPNATGFVLAAAAQEAAAVAEMPAAVTVSGAADVTFKSRVANPASSAAAAEAAT